MSQVLNHLHQKMNQEGRVEAENGSSVKEVQFKVVVVKAGKEEMKVRVVSEERTDRAGDNASLAVLEDNVLEEVPQEEIRMAHVQAVERLEVILAVNAAETQGRIKEIEIKPNSFIK